MYCFIIPCYNEENRLNREKFEAWLLQYPEHGLVLVNDGSKDQTWNLLSDIASSHENCQAINLPKNVGKANAVRAGMNQAFASNYSICGYLDADLATPFSEALRLCKHLEQNPSLEFLFGSRILRVGSTIKRKSTRHYGGRVIATMISMTLRLPIYDTQCGAKFFRNNTTSKSLFQDAFVSRWLFDVEIFFRFIGLMGSRKNATQKMLEAPLEVWLEQGDSKVTFTDILKIPFELLKIKRRYPY